MTVLALSTGAVSPAALGARPADLGNGQFTPKFWTGHRGTPIFDAADIGSRYGVDLIAVSDPHSSDSIPVVCN